MAFSYCATAMSRPALEASSVAMLRPISKIGRLICGRNDQTRRVPLPNRSSSSWLERPNMPVSVMRGKKLARAAPMLALAATNCCSAARMSGRRNRTPEGSPTCTLAKRESVLPIGVTGVDWDASLLGRSTATEGTGGSRFSGRVWPTSNVSALMSWARMRRCCATAALAVAVSDSA